MVYSIFILTNIIYYYNLLLSNIKKILLIYYCSKIFLVLMQRLNPSWKIPRIYNILLLLLMSVANYYKISRISWYV